MRTRGALNSHARCHFNFATRDSARDLNSAANGLMELSYLHFIMRMSVFTFISVLRLVAWLVNLQVATAYELPY